MKTTHDIPDWGKLTLDLIHDRLGLDKRAALVLQEQVDEAIQRRDEHLQAMERRYVRHLGHLAQSMGLEVPDGSLLTGHVGDYTIEIRHPPEEGREKEECCADQP